MICFICGLNFGNWKALHIHAKHFPELQLNFQIPEQPCTNSSLPSLNAETINKNNLLTENENAEIPFNFELVSELLYKSAVELVVNLHSNNNFSRVDIVNIQVGIVEKILTPIVSMLKKVVGDEIKEPILLSKFHRVASVIENTFLYCSTEYRLLDWLINNEFLSKINQFTINNEICPVQHIGETIFDEKNTTDNFVQGTLWKQKVSQYSNDKIIIPFFLYMDEFEINNPLGSHSTFQSVSAVYYSFPLAENSSKLTNIFLAALVKHVDLSSFGNDKCLESLVNEINILESEGVSISTEDGYFHVHFVLGIILGDNLGLNSLLEFSKSFSANFFCRFCKAHKTVTKLMHEEDLSAMRNVHNYSVDVASSNFIETGIYKESLLNRVTHFHVTQNFCIDIMHDLYEGICHYDICHILTHFIDTTKLFSLETLNNRKMNFNYGPIEVGNISPPIKIVHLKKRHLKMSAREVMTFVHFLPLMIGDLIPENDEFWTLFLILLQIIDILLSYTFTDNAISHLKQLISQHNSMYVTLFNDSLKPKHHFLVHYPTIIKHSGPPRHYWCFRYEAKHKELKMYARVTTSRKNITLTLAKKYQLKFAQNLMETNKNIIFKDKHKIINL
eukprot:XP_008183097.1 PREDICTED: uncharacterized protein LOC103309442 [Acyrthosiphon pisum]